MSMKKIVALTAMAAGLTAQAASTSTSTTSLSNLYQKLKESPVSFDLLSETATVRGQEGFTNTTIGYIGYKLTDVDSLKMENRVTFNRFEGSESTRFSRWVLSYNRGKLLTQDKHGVNMSAKLEQRIYPDADMRGELNQNGLTRASVKLSRSFGDVFSLSGTLYGAVTQRRDKDLGKTTKSYTYASIVENFQITDKWYVAFIQEPYIGKRTNGTQSANIYNVLETGYQVTPELLAAVYTANTLVNDGGDKLSIRNLGPATRGQEYAFYLYLNAF